MTGADIVVGSGPSGMAVALARLERGRRVILLDGGRLLEPEARERRAAMAAREPRDWAAAERDAWGAGQRAAPEGQVRRFGSDWAMEPAAATFAGGDPVALRASRAVGGLSHLWGAAVLPWRPSDLDGWPVAPAELDASWAALAAWVPVAGRADDLAALFPGLGMAGREPLEAGPGPARALARLARRREALAALGVRAGAARQAVAPGCRLCGLCLHGCPWGLIWSAAAMLGALRADPALGPRLDHRPGTVVRAVEEGPGGATARLADGTAVEGDRLFLAAGVLETARILMASPGGPAAMTLRDSQFAFLPLLQARAMPEGAPHHTLTQAFVELDDPEGGPRSAHAQLYGWNEFYARDLGARFGRLLPGAAVEALARRLVVAQAFLHSDLSHSIAVTPAADGRLATRLLRNPATDGAMAATLRRLGRALRLGGLHALRPAARMAAPGASFHVGASLPMARDPGPGRSDRLGRPAGAARLHVVDASVLPAVPATTITFGVMGNAHRIGREAPP